MTELLPYRALLPNEARRMSIEERLWSGAVEDENGCWVWQRSRTTSGYGQIWVSGKIQTVHRVSYELAVGPIPDGLVLDHLCRNPPCIRPEHLEAVTQQVNTLRGIGVAAKNARKTQCDNGHPYTEESVRVLRRGQSKWRACIPCQQEAGRRKWRKIKASRLSEPRSPQKED